MRTRAAPDFTNSRSAIAARAAAVAAPPGCSAPKSSTGCASTKRYLPPERGQAAAEQLGPGQRLRMAVDRAAHRRVEVVERRGERAPRSAWPCCTPRPSRPSEANRPRAEGSATSWPRNGCASIVPSSSACSVLGSRNSSPLPRQVGRGVRPVRRVEVRAVGLQPVVQRGGGGVRLLGDRGVDDQHDQVFSPAGSRGPSRSRAAATAGWRRTSRRCPCSRPAGSRPRLPRARPAARPPAPSAAHGACRRRPGLRAG